MINALLLKPKKIQLNDIFNYKTNPVKNMYRSGYFYNYAKFRRRKWKFQRSARNISDEIIFKRYAPNIMYIPNYTKLLKNKGRDTVKINENKQLFTYRSKLRLKQRLLNFFLIRKAKLLKKFLICRHITTHFNNFDVNYEVLLLRLGIALSIEQARVFIKGGVLKINGHIMKQNHHLNHLDFVQFNSKAVIKIKRTHSTYSRDLRKYVYNIIFYDIQVIYSLLIRKTYKLDIKNFLGLLPFTSTFNFSNFSFIYFNYLIKNQWHFFINFYVSKKFIQYGR